MKLNFLIIILIFFLTSKLIAQTPDTLWTKTIGGLNMDTGNSIKQTNDGGFIIVGATNSFGAGDYDVYLIRTNESGDTMWTRTYGGVLADYGSEVQQTLDEGYIIIGLTKSFNNNGDDLYLIKTDSNGNSLWTKVYGGTWGDAGRSIIQDGEGNYFAVGYTLNFDPGNADVWLLKFDEFGDTLWTRRFGGNETEYGYSINQCDNGDYIITGYTQSFSPNHDIYLLRTDSSGNAIWTNHYGGQGLDFGAGVIEMNDGGFAIAGYTTSYSAGSYDCYLVRINLAGDTLWTKYYGGEYDDKIYAIELFDDGILLAGYIHNAGLTERDAFLIKTDFNGEILWTKTVGGLYNDWVFDMYKINDNELILTGQFDEQGDDNHDVWLIRFDNILSSVEDELQPLVYYLFQNYPNPFNPSTKIKFTIPSVTLRQAQSDNWVTLKVYDILGNEIATLVNEEKPAGEYEVEFNTVGTSRDLSLPSGIYLYQLKAGSFIETKKMLLLK